MLNLLKTTGKLFRGVFIKYPRCWLFYSFEELHINRSLAKLYQFDFDYIMKLWRPYTGTGCTNRNLLTCFLGYLKDTPVNPTPVWDSPSCAKKVQSLTGCCCLKTYGVSLVYLQTSITSINLMKTGRPDSTPAGGSPLGAPETSAVPLRLGRHLLSTDIQ